MTAKIPDDAFDFYVALGPGRSHRAVAEKFGVTKRGVTKFASREKWVERLERIEQEVRERGDKKLIDTMEEMQNRHRQTAQAMLGRGLEGLKQYPITSAMDAVRTVEKAIKLERLIVGEPTERSAHTIEEITRQEINDLLVADHVGSSVNDTGGGSDEDW